MRRGERWMARSTARVFLISSSLRGRLGLLAQLLLQVVVQVFVGVVVRGVGRQVEQLDLVAHGAATQVLTLLAWCTFRLSTIRNTFCPASLASRRRKAMNRSAFKAPS